MEAADSWVFISANGSVDWVERDARAHFEIGTSDYPNGDSNIDRWVALHNDEGWNGGDDGMALTHLRYLEKGSHTISLLGRRDYGSGTVQVFDSTLSVLAFGPAEIYLPVVTR